MYQDEQAQLVKSQLPGPGSRVSIWQRGALSLSELKENVEGFNEKSHDMMNIMGQDREPRNNIVEAMDSQQGSLAERFRIDRNTDSNQNDRMQFTPA